jgi:hypothetical protein
MDDSTAPFDTSEEKKPERYIRTFAGDLETLQAGGVPELTELKETRPAPAERLVASSPIREMPLPTPAPIPGPQKEAPSYTPPAPLDAPIKTYEGDFSERMKETNASPATVLAAEQDRTQREAPQAVPEEEKTSRANLLYIIAGVILILAGGVGAFYAYSRYLATSAPVVLTAGPSAPIFVDEREQISGTGAALVSAITQSINRPFTSGTIRLISIATTTSGTVFAALPLSAPAVLLRNVNMDGSMAGVVTVSGIRSPFFILSVSSYSTTFAGMLSWEGAMPNNLAALFPAYPSAPAPTTSTTTPQTATTTPVATTKPGFRDEVVSNHDVRVYRDSAGRSILLYGYWNQSTLVIARNPSAFAEIIGRLATSRAQN